MAPAQPKGSWGAPGDDTLPSATRGTQPHLLSTCFRAKEPQRSPSGQRGPPSHPEARAGKKPHRVQVTLDHKQAHISSQGLHTYVLRNPCSPHFLKASESLLVSFTHAGNTEGPYWFPASTKTTNWQLCAGGGMPAISAEGCLRTGMARPSCEGAQGEGQTCAAKGNQNIPRFSIPPRQQKVSV